MCVSIKAPAPPPMPEPIPIPPPNTVSGAITRQNAPASADASGRNVNVASTYQRRRVGRGSLRIPLSSSGLSASGLNLPSG
jgi:hypothetical protein|tara:strand:+ start:103 stop:345 length:243 start_codon:yes stop_codon:yes gene_type:complete